MRRRFGTVTSEARYAYDLNRLGILTVYKNPLLCMGVPFVNPIQQWDAQHPEDREAWMTQHDGLKYENPPHVYNVHANDVAGFWAAVKQAMETGIEGDR